MRMLVPLMLSQSSLQLSFFPPFILSSAFCSAAVISTALSSRPYIHSSPLVILLLISSSILFICLLVHSCRFLVNIFCIFSIVFLRSRIIFTIIILNSFSGRLPISTLFGCFSGVLSCPFIRDITFCFFILINFL